MMRISLCKPLSAALLALSLLAPAAWGDRVKDLVAAR